MENLKDFFKTGKWILIGMMAIIVSMGSINCSWAFARLHGIDPVNYSTQGIYWVFGIINLVFMGFLIWKGVKNERKTEEK